MLGTPEIMLIALAVLLLIFGPNQLPKLGSAIGKTMKNVREGMESDSDDEESDGEEEDADAAPAK